MGDGKRREEKGQKEGEMKMAERGKGLRGRTPTDNSFSAYGFNDDVRV